MLDFKVPGIRRKSGIPLLSMCCHKIKYKRAKTMTLISSAIMTCLKMKTCSIASIMELLKVFGIYLLNLFFICKQFLTKYTAKKTVKRSKSVLNIEEIPLYPGQSVPQSVNYHFTRKCNYECGFCFHTAKTSYVLPMEDAKRGLRMLKDCGKFLRRIYCYLWLKYLYFTSVGMEKINFSGGEPFIHNRGRYLGELVRFCKQELKLSSVSIVSNGSLIRESWFTEFGKYPSFVSVTLLCILATRY